MSSGLWKLGAWQQLDLRPPCLPHTGCPLPGLFSHVSHCRYKGGFQLSMHPQAFLNLSSGPGCAPLLTSHHNFSFCRLCPCATSREVSQIPLVAGASFSQPLASLVLLSIRSAKRSVISSPEVILTGGACVASTLRIPSLMTAALSSTFSQ